MDSTYRAQGARNWGEASPEKYDYMAGRILENEEGYDSSQGVVIVFSAETLKEARAVVRQALRDNVWPEFSPAECGHGHDCCGCAFTQRYEISRLNGNRWIGINEWAFNY